MTANEDYYRKRIDEEFVAAEASGDEVISQIHRDLAQHYRDLLGVAPPPGQAPDVGPGTDLG